jgi:hypothetical protein
LLANNGRRAEALDLYQQALSRPGADVAQIRTCMKDMAGSESEVLV